VRLLCLSALRLAQQPTYSPTCLRNSKAANRHQLDSRMRVSPSPYATPPPSNP